MNSEFDRIAAVQPLIRNLYETSKEKLGFGPDAKIVIITNEKNSKNPLGKTAYYDPSNYKIGLYTKGRHIKDIMRSLSHELVHHSQNCRGDFNEGLATVEGYAQEDSHLREMEREAYETGNLIFRDWEDNYKRNNNNKLFIDTSVMGEKLMEDKEKGLREIVRGLVKEILVSIKEEGDGDSSFFSPDMIKATADQQQAADADAAALAAESPAGQEEQWAAASGDEGDEDELQEGKPSGEKREKPQAGTDVKAEKETIKRKERRKAKADLKKELGEEKMTGPSSEACRNAKDAFEAEYYCNESLNESFFPTKHDIREIARKRTHDSLMKRWGYTKKRK